jgi:fucose 4-O-acetylase-like acetyltransferase
MFIQNIINCAVAGFVFLAGYFINTEELKRNTKHFIIRKLQRILIPYIFWSIFFIVFNFLIYHKTYSVFSTVKALLLGQAAAPLWYCILYLLLISIIPFVVKRMENKIWNIIFYSIMPVWFIIVYYLQLKYEISYSNWGILPISWFLYFYIGLKWKNKPIKLSISICILFICLAYIIELIESSYIFSITNSIRFSVTPIRFSPNILEVIRH